MGSSGHRRPALKAPTENRFLAGTRSTQDESVSIFLSLSLFHGPLLLDVDGGGARIDAAPGSVTVVGAT